MSSFADLGLPEQLAANAADVGYDVPTDMQRMAIPVLRRGNNVIITATSGAGATAAYALALIDRFIDADSPRALVLAPSAERAHQIAAEPLEFSHGKHVSVRYRALLDRQTSIDVVSAQLLAGGAAGLSSVSWETSKKELSL